MAERSMFNPIPEGQPAYNPIGRVSVGSLSREYNLVACRRCGAALPEEGVYRDQHDGFHLGIDKLYEWALLQEQKAGNA
ncbi:DNA binding protein [Arthrobacter phage Beagle]|nr:DNA binding protein [Arthrobacter phage Beagle]QOP66758.1 DNA binding protein [Arthrobacter phage Odyssey395]